MTKFPLTEQLGLTPRALIETGGKIWIEASDLEAILEKAPIRYGVRAPKSDSPVTLEDFVSPEDTLQCRILLIEPIKKDTAESLLKEGLAFYEGDRPRPGITDWIKRARRVVGNPE